MTGGVIPEGVVAAEVVEVDVDALGVEPLATAVARDHGACGVEDSAAHAQESAEGGARLGTGRGWGWSWGWGWGWG